MSESNIEVDQRIIDDTIKDRRMRDDVFNGRPRRRSDPGFRDLNRGLKWLAGFLGTIVVCTTSVVSISSLAPWVTNASAEKMQKATDARFSVAEEHLGAVDKRLDAIDLTGLRTLNLQLRATLRSIDADLRTLPTSAPGRENLNAQRDEAQLNLDDVNRQLRAAAARKGQTP